MRLVVAGVKQVVVNADLVQVHLLPGLPPLQILITCGHCCVFDGEVIVVAFPAYELKVQILLLFRLDVHVIW